MSDSIGSKQSTIINYMLTTVENNYTKNVRFNTLNENNVEIDAIVASVERVNPVIWMIEANMYKNRELRVKNVEHTGDGLDIVSFDDISYRINVKTE